MKSAMDKLIKKHVVLAILTFLGVIMLTGSLTYALFQIDKDNSVNQKIALGNLSANITSINGKVILNDLFPKLKSELTDNDKYYEFTITNDGDYDLKYQVYLKDATDTLLSASTEYSEYKRITPDYYKYINFTLDDGRTQNLASVMKDDKFILLDGKMNPGYTKDHKIRFFIDMGETTAEGAPNDINGSILSLDIFLDAVAYDKEFSGPAYKTLASLNLKEAGNNIVDFAYAATTDETSEGLYSLEDDYGISYFYRGAVENNYVKFGDYFWRIIRINGDGSLRMIYDGTQAYANGTSDAGKLAWTNQVFNTNSEDAKYVGYMYGPAGTVSSTSREEAQTNTESSTIKTKLEEWYVNNIKSKGLDQYVADSIFCNDRSIPGRDATGWSGDTGLGYGKNWTAYGVSSRIGASWTEVITNLQPSFVCPQKNDAFTVSDKEKGNGALDEKVGLITADEIVAAGSGKCGVRNLSYYLYKGDDYWSLSPSYYLGWADMFDVGVWLSDSRVYFTRGVAPVINLKAEYVKTLRGEGTMSSPYTAE